MKRPDCPCFSAKDNDHIIDGVNAMTLAMTEMFHILLDAHRTCPVAVEYVATTVILNLVSAAASRAAGPDAPADEVMALTRDILERVGPNALTLMNTMTMHVTDEAQGSQSLN